MRVKPNYYLQKLNEKLIEFLRKSDKILAFLKNSTAKRYEK